MFKRAVSGLQDNLNEGDAEQPMATVLLCTMSETGTEEVFDGMAPKLTGMGRMPLEASTLFGDGIISDIVHLLAKGKDEMHHVVKIRRKELAILDKQKPLTTRWVRSWVPEGSDDDRRPLPHLVPRWLTPSTAMQPRGPRRPSSR